MTVFRVVARNMSFHFSSSLLGVLLSALGMGILCLIWLLSVQLDEQVAGNNKHIDLVVGAKGSPLQLILNSIYQVDYPTGNIPLEEAQRIARSPLVKRAVPLSMGDNYQGFRIVGTDSSFQGLYEAKLSAGRWFAKDFETVLGADVVEQKQLKLGDQVIGAHGLSSSEDLHADHPYTVVGILEKNNSVADRLVLTNLASVWEMHEHEEHHHQEEEENPGEVHHLIEVGGDGKEITSMLIQYKNPTAVALFPRMVNQSSQLQAASPAVESARLFSLLGIGLDALKVLAGVILTMALISVFVSVYHSFKNRKYELAIMRTMGASRAVLFQMMILEGVLITFFGTLIGIGLAHLMGYLVALLNHGRAVIPWGLGVGEWWILLVGILLGFFAAFIPAIRAYWTAISTTLSR